VPHVRPSVHGPKTMGAAPTIAFAESISEPMSVSIRADVPLQSDSAMTHTPYERLTLSKWLLTTKGTALLAAEKLASLKGTAFRPYITAVQMNSAFSR
jgi:hypothetical protein